MSTASAVDLTDVRAVTGAFCAALNAGSLDRACSCFTRDGCLITPDGTSVHGRGAISGVLAQVVGAGTRISIEVSAIVAAGDVALGREMWRIESRVPGGGSFAREPSPTLVLRRIEARWKLALAAPWGWGQLRT